MCAARLASGIGSAGRRARPCRLPLAPRRVPSTRADGATSTATIDVDSPRSCTRPRLGSPRTAPASTCSMNVGAAGGRCRERRAETPTNHPWELARGAPPQRPAALTSLPSYSRRPLADTLVVFRSDRVLHKVEPCHVPRYAHGVHEHRALFARDGAGASCARVKRALIRALTRARHPDESPLQLFTSQYSDKIFKIILLSTFACN